MALLTKSTLLKFYKRSDIQEALVFHAQNKELGVRYGEDIFGKRPDVLQYPKDVLELALQDATSLHCSEELWDNPLALSSDLSRKELDQLRKGWDLVLDIDYKYLEYSKIATNLIVEFLRSVGVTEVSVKFSGNKGFHIGVPFEAFPQHIGEIPTKNLFPEIPRKIDLYLRERIKEIFVQKILKFESGSIDKIY